MSPESRDLVKDAVMGPAYRLVDSLPEGTRLDAWYAPAFECRNIFSATGSDALERVMDRYDIQDVEIPSPGSPDYAGDGDYWGGLVLEGKIESPHVEGVTGMLEVRARVPEDIYEEALEESVNR